MSGESRKTDAVSGSVPNPEILDPVEPKLSGLSDPDL
jgi:hypothetical protein